MNKRNIKFPLIMKNKIEVRTLEELRENFSLECVLEYFVEGKLKIWLNDRYYEDEAIQIGELEGKGNSNVLKEKLCEILEVEYEVNDDLEINEIELLKKRISKLRLYTDEETIIKKVDNVAFNQEELSDLLDEDKAEIYLCSDEFVIPIGRKNISYYGISNPVVNITTKNDVDFDKNNIIFNDIIITSKNTISIKVIKSKGIKLAGNISDGTQDSKNEEKLVNICWDKININHYEEYKDYIYYYDNLIGAFFRINKATNENIEITNETIECFKICNDIIYYHDEINLYAMDMDGGNKTLIQEDILYFAVDKENIYFTRAGSYYRSCSWGPEKMINKKPYIFNIKEKTVKNIPYCHKDDSGVDGVIQALDGWLYYIYRYDRKLYRIKSNLTSRQRITDELGEGKTFYIVGNWVYFVDYTRDKECIKKVKLNGLDETIICWEGAISLQISGKYIFYMNSDYGIYRINLDGRNKLKICEDCRDYKVIGDWLYYENVKKDFMIYKVNINGGTPIPIMVE